MLKKFLLSLAIFTTLMSVSPKAKAGLGVGFLFGNPTAGAIIGGVGLTAYFTTATLIRGREDETALWGILFIPIVAGLGVLLDERADESFVEAFQQKYPFIDNREALQNLAALSREKLANHLEGNETSNDVTLTFTEAELEGALATADLTSSDFSYIVNDLK